MGDKYYRLDNLLERMATNDSHFGILLGQRSNGKSYATKEFAVNASLGKSDYKQWYNNDGSIKPRFIYLRRWGEDISTNGVTRYFKDLPILKMSKGLFEGIEAYGDGIYVVNYEDGKSIRKHLIGYICSLNNAEHYKSQAYADVDIIIYEEFVTNSLYLRKEPTELQQFASTVFRQKRKNKFCFMIGNTMSRVCPYFYEWCLVNIPKQKQGTIDKYEIAKMDGDKEIIFVEYCEKVNTGKSIFFGKASEQIDGGAWECEEMPHLPCEYNEMERKYTVSLTHMGFSFRISLCKYKKDYFIYVFPCKQERIDKYRRVLTKEFNPNKYYSDWFKREYKVESFMMDLMKDGKICYSDNLCGSDFNTILKNYK